jgi:hypothetical protein
MKSLYRLLSIARVRLLGWPILIVIGALQFTGCAVGPKYKAPSVPAPPAYKEIGIGRLRSRTTRTLAETGGRSFRIHSSIL